MIGGSSENELMLHSALVAFSEAAHMLLRNQVEKRAVLENLDLLVLCLDETIDDGYVCSLLSLDFCAFRSLFSAGQATVVLVALRGLFLTNHLFQCGVQNHRGDRLNDHRVKSEQAKSGYDGDRHQRTNSHERVFHAEGEDAAENPAAITSSCSMFLSCFRRCRGPAPLELLIPFHFPFPSCVFCVKGVLCILADLPDNCTSIVLFHG